MDVRWYGVAGGSTGYAVEARAFVGALRRFGHPVDFREIRTDYALVPSDEQPPATDLDVLSPADVVVVHHPWPGLPAGPGLPPVVWRTMFETTRAPTFFAREAQRTQGIWVPSRFCREVLADSGIPRGLVHLLPPGLPDHIEAASPASPREPARVFTFLSLFRWQLRKGWDVLVDAFASEFRGVDDVRLVIKTDPFDRAQPLVPHRQLADRLTDLRRRLGDRLPPISLDVRELSSEAVVELYRSADAFVLPSRGEGWGLGTFEALALGLPTIGTRWGGSLDYLTDRGSYLIDARTVPVSPQAAAEWPLFTGGHWAEPDLDHLRSLMRTVYENPDQARAKSLVASREIHREYAADQTVRRLETLVQALS